MSDTTVQRVRTHCLKVATEVLQLSGELSCSLKPLGDGLNFLSDAFFVEIAHESGVKNIFVKVPPQSGNVRQTLFEALPRDAFFFEREFYFYNSALDLYKSLIANEGEDMSMVDFVATSLPLPGDLSFSRGYEEPLVLEDLSASGYRMWPDEFNGLDVKHIMVCLETYGKLHGLGMVLLDKKKITDDNLNKLINMDITTFYTDLVKDMVDRGMANFIDWFSKNKEEESKSKLESLLKDRNYMKVLKNSFEKGKKDEMRTLTHGDARSNNFLFKYDSDDVTPVGMVLLDFQAAIICSPFYDLLYFFTMSVSANVLQANYSSFISRYHTSLVSTLSRLNYSKRTPSYSSITQGITMYAPMIMAPMSVTINLISGEGNPDLDPQLRDNKFRSALQICKFLGVL